MTTRNVRPFVHLRVLSSYSLGLGLSSPGDICRHARRAGFDAVALTDVSGTYGFLELHRAARETGVKPIYGTLVFLDWKHPGGESEPVQSLIVLAIDRTGLRNVCAVASESAVLRERRDALFASHLDAFTDGVVAIARVEPKASGLSARHLLGPLHDLFADRLFVECRTGLADTSAQDEARAAAAELGIACVLTQDVRYVGPARPHVLDLLSARDEPGFEHRVFSDARAGDSSSDRGMATAAEISGAYDELPEAFTNASLVASLVQPDLLDALEEAPSTSTGDMFGVTRREHALRSRLLALEEAATTGAPAAERAATQARVEHELSLIESAELETMLLRFERLVGLLRDAGARLGPATGLGVQSRCAYLLGITAYDPYAKDPRFEPSFGGDASRGHVFDLQISTEDRPAVLAIVNRAFAGASVGYVPSVEHLTAARSMRLAAKWLETPAAELEEAIKASTRFPGVTLRQLAEQSLAFAALYRRSAAFRDLVAHAASIEGLPFGFARAKRTVVVSPRPLRDFFGYTVRPETGDHFVQSPRDSFPAGAVLRIDLALLRVLAILPADLAREAIDPDAYRLVEKEDLAGVHLLEGAPGRLAPSFGIRSFDDLVHFVALTRRRGSGMSLAARLSAFRANPRAVPAGAHVHDVVAPTAGILLFRDQLRDVAVALTGWTRAHASAFVARLSDHSPGNLAAMRGEFFRHTVEQSVSLEDATAWFARLVREASWAVDRQRVMAECMLTERCLHMKWTRRDEFLAQLERRAGERRIRPAPPGRPDSRRAAQAASPALPVVENAPGERAERPQQAGLPGLLEEKDPSSIISSRRRNPNQGFDVLSSVSELYPHPTSTPVQLQGRIRNLQTFSNSSSQRVGYFELIDSSGSVRIFVPAERLARFGERLANGNHVMVQGTVRVRDGHKVCDALEIGDSQGGIGIGETSADPASTGDP